MVPTVVWLAKLISMGKPEELLRGDVYDGPEAWAEPYVLALYITHEACIQSHQTFIEITNR